MSRTHPAAYIDWVCPGCKTLYEVDPMYEPDDLCPSCQREEDEFLRQQEEECDCRGCLSA